MSEAAPATAYAERERSFLSLLAGVFVAPGDAFRTVAARPRWEAPLLLAIAIGLAFTAVWISKVDPVEFMRMQMEEAGGLEGIPAEKRAEVLQGQARWFQAFSWVVPLFLVPMSYAALAGLLLFVFRFFHGADAGYAQSMAVVAWCFAAFGLVMKPLILLVMALKDEWTVDPDAVVQASGAALLDKATTAPSLYALAGSLDLFSFWLLALLSIGYGAVIGRPATTAAWSIVGLWAAYVLGKCAWAALF
jgi:hypothetical protein